MWTSALKFLFIFFLKNRMNLLKHNFFDKLNTNANAGLKDIELSRLKENIAAMAESRAAIFKQNFSDDVRRLVNSIFGFMLILLALILSLLTGIMWLFAAAWTSPNREIILSVTMLIPIILAIIVYFYIRHSWQKQPLLHQSMLQIESDWQVFRAAFNGKADNVAGSMDELNL